MAAPAGEIALAQIMAELRDQLAAGEADAVWWPSLPTESAESAAAEKIGARLRRQHFAEVHQHRFLELPESFDAFLASRSRKLRSGIRYTAKRLRAAFGDELVFADLHTSGDTERIACDFEAIAAGTYQRGLGTGFEATPERRALLTLGSQRGWLRAYALYHRDTPIAFWHGWAYRRTYFSSSTGYDPRYAEHRVGIHLLMHVINDLIADPGVDVLDYGFGDAEYKRQYGTSSFPEQDVLVFAPTARGIGVNLVRTGIIGSANLTKRSLDAMGLTDRVKKRWRRWLRERGPA
jgi:hypothetical protein